IDDCTALIDVSFPHLFMPNNRVGEGLWPPPPGKGVPAEMLELELTERIALGELGQDAGDSERMPDELPVISRRW
ncbi:MAG: hypothetical protein NWS56_01525, partial [Haliea sp.]|nr:hypothetical protein [Haliea sp.]